MRRRLLLLLAMVVAVVVVEAALDVRKQAAKEKRQRSKEKRQEILAHRCGFYTDCPMNYTTQWINESVAAQASSNQLAAQASSNQQLLHEAARARCEHSKRFAILGGSGGSGGWCLVEPSTNSTSRDVGRIYKPGWVSLPNGQGYTIPGQHVRADGPILEHLIELVDRDPSTSFVDIGRSAARHCRSHSLPPPLPSCSHYHPSYVHHNHTGYSRRRPRFRHHSNHRYHRYLKATLASFQPHHHHHHQVRAWARLDTGCCRHGQMHHTEATMERAPCRSLPSRS